ncbi:MAG: ribonuclease PH [Alphaproteobacteria bacterium]
MSRAANRKPDALRPIILEPGVSRYAEGSCLSRFGNTHVLCTATVEEKPPAFLRGTGLGWVTAEYGMLPRATHTRSDREAAKGKQSGRTQEIQRLVGRALRVVVNRKDMGEIQIKVDCDVLQADGGTRTAAITGGYVALYGAFMHLVRKGVIKQSPILYGISAISCGIVRGVPMLDLDYDEDSNADTDANFVFTANGGMVEIQATAEKEAFSPEHFQQLLALARKGTDELAKIQQQVIDKHYH